MGAPRTLAQRVNRIWAHTLGAVVLVLIGIALLFATLIIDVDPVWPLAIAISSITLGLSALVSCIKDASELALSPSVPRFDVQLQGSGANPEWIAEQIAARKQQRGTE